MFHQRKVLLYNKISLLIVSKNCLGIQFTNKFLGTSSTNVSSKNVMFYIYWLSCSNSCAQSSSPFEHGESWFLKKRLYTNLSTVLIDVKYTRDWQLGLKKNLQDSVVKPIIFVTQKMKFFIKDLFNKCVLIPSFIRICSLNKFLTKKFIFCVLICESRHKTTVKMKITHFLKSYVASSLTFFEKVFAICKFLPLGV